MDNERDNYENNNSARGLAGSLLDAAADRKVRQDNIDAIKNRQGKNEPIRPKTDEDESAPKEKSGLDKKDELENKKDTKDIKEDSEPKKHRNLDDFKKESLDRLTGIDKLKKNWAKIAIVSKVAMFLIGILVSLSFVLLIFAALIGTYDVFSNGLSNFFGLPESDTSNGSRDGLYTSTKYKYDQDGNELNAVELVQTLKEDSNCDFSGWSYFKDWLSGNKIEDPCKFIRYIKKETVDSDNGVDPSLVIATIFYAYDTEPLTVQYDYPEEIPKNRISSVEHFETLKRILDTKDNEFTTDTLDTIIKNSYITRNSYYYTWEVDDSKEDEVSGSCKVTPGPKTKEYSLDKWKIFMRFGSDLAEKYDKSFDVGYLKESSDEECNGSISDSDLKTRLGGLKENANVVVDTSSARNAMQEKSENLNGILCHADVDSKAKDDCSPYDYRSGFVYNNFLGYKNSFSEYDEIFTPKNIEYTINEIVSKKTLLNEALLLEDKDTDPINGGTSVGPVVVGAYCKDYLKTQGKYYMVDTGLRNFVLGYKDTERGHILENVVFLELLSRGYKVSIGKVDNKEVDFIATTFNDKKYIQITETMISEDVRTRELSPLKSIKDNYEKIVLTMDTLFTNTNENGIKILNLIDWLLNV